MARIDALCLLSDAQAFTVDAVSTNVYNCGSVTPKRQIGTGRPLALTVQVDVTADFGTTDETYEFQLIQSLSETMTSPVIIGQQTYIAGTIAANPGVLVSPLLVAGYIFVIPIPPGLPLMQFLAMWFNGGGNTPLITVTAWLGRQDDAPIKPQTFNTSYSIAG